MNEQGTRPGGVVTQAHAAVRECLFEGAVAVDATAGNGRDTLFLARLVGETGKVYALDVQPEAVSRTRALVETEGLGERVVVCHGSHTRLKSIWPELVPGTVRAIMFNLGYLPGGDKSLITQAESTLAGLEQALPLLAPGGVISVVCYPGHAGGDAESVAVSAWTESLPAAGFVSRVDRPSDRSANAPFLVTVTRRSVS